MPHSTRATIAQAILAALLFLIGLLPLFGGPTYEFALASGLLAPSWIGVIAALTVLGGSAGPSASAEQAIAQALGLGVRGVVLVAGVALIHGLRVGFCDFWGQWALFSLGPLCGVLCGAAWGGAVGLACRQIGGKIARVVAVSLTIAGPLTGVAISVFRYYTSPIIFAFDPFVGFFAGTLYDTVIDGTNRLLSYRCGSLGAIVALYALARLVDIRADLGWARLRQRSGSALLFCCGAVTALCIVWFGPELGHFQTTSTVRKALGRVAKSQHCEVVYASGIFTRDAHALARECDGYVEEQAKYFEIAPPQKITVYLFRSARQKARYMGAFNTYIAKPWRKEIYIQASGYPHPVLGHELAHVMAGQFGQGPFRIAGIWGALVPDPGRIEGVAVAASPRLSDPLTLLQWAKAMQDLELLPPLNKVFKLSFLGENSSTAYTVAGAFLSWLHAQRGPEPIKAWYAGQSVESAFGKPLAALQKQFLAALSKVSVPERAMAVAKARFDRSGLFGRHCPHQVDAINAEAYSALSRYDPQKAKRLYDRVLGLDPNDITAQLGKASCSQREGKLKQAFNELLKLGSKQDWNKRYRATAQEEAGDIALLQRHISKARGLFEEVRQSVVSEDQQRALDVRELIKAGNDPASVALRALFVGDPELGSDFAVTSAKLARWSERDPKNGTADYLLGKNLFNRGRWKEAARALDRALERQLRLERVKREALRTRLFVGCALGQRQRAAEVRELYLRDSGLTAAAREGIERFAVRCGLSSTIKPSE